MDAPEPAAHGALPAAETLVLFDFLAGGGALLCDATWKICHATPGASAVLGWTAGHLEGKRPADFLMATDRAALEAQMALSMDGRSIGSSMALRVAGADGKLRHVTFSLYRRQDEALLPNVRLVLRVTDASDDFKVLARIASTEEQLAPELAVDQQSGLMSAALFEMRMAAAWHKAVLDRSSLSLVFLEVSSLEDLLASHGDSEVKALLSTLASALRGITRRQSDCLARIEDRCLVALLPESTPELATRAAESVLELAIKTALPPATYVSIKVWSASTRPEQPLANTRFLASARDAGNAAQPRPLASP